jgi:hypothetical protein
MQGTFKALFAAALLVFSAGCAREWQNPESALPAQDIAIASILASPDAYDMSGVEVIGKVWNLRYESHGVNEYGEEELYTTFMIADRKGIGIDVFVKGEAPIVEGDYLKVTGLFRKQFQTTGPYFYSRIDAVCLEGWSPNLTYWVREFEFD